MSLSRILAFSILTVTSVLAKEDYTPRPLKELLPASVFTAPAIHPAPDFDVSEEIKAVFYETLPYKGKSTRAFAYYGIPKSDKPVPAIVCVHGGGGRAFEEWVQVWNERGYAAISMSLEGYMPGEKRSEKLSHPHSGPKRAGRFNDSRRPLAEQWMYHAVSDIILAHSFLRSLPEVDPERIGVTGISWGGILSSLITGVDDRFQCAIPVYGAGFLYESLGHFSSVKRDSQKFWDPSHQFKNSDLPTLWVNSDRDGHFSLNITSRSYELTQDHAQILISPGMKHGHHVGWDPVKTPEIYTFADHHLKGGESLGQITQQPSGKACLLKFQSPSPIKEATVHYLTEPLTYREQPKDKHPRPSTWLTLDANIDPANQTVTAELPAEAKTYYVNLTDERGLRISSKLIEISAEQDLEPGK